MVFLIPCTWRFGVLTHCARFSANSVRGSYSAGTPRTVFPPFLSRRSRDLVHHAWFHCHSCHRGPESRATSHSFPSSFLAVVTKALPLRMVFLTPCTWRFGILTHCARFSADSVRSSYSASTPSTVFPPFLSRRNWNLVHHTRFHCHSCRGGPESRATPHIFPSPFLAVVTKALPLRTLYRILPINKSCRSG